MVLVEIFRAFVSLGQDGSWTPESLYNTVFVMNPRMVGSESTFDDRGAWCGSRDTVSLWMACRRLRWMLTQTTR